MPYTIYPLWFMLLFFNLTCLVSTSSCQSICLGFPRVLNNTLPVPSLPPFLFMTIFWHVTFILLKRKHVCLRDHIFFTFCRRRYKCMRLFGYFYVILWWSRWGLRYYCTMLCMFYKFLLLRLHPLSRMFVWYTIASI